MKLKKENFHSYYDSGIGDPFEKQDIIRFCFDNQHLFTDKTLMDDKECMVCGDLDGVEYFYNFYYETDCDMELFKAYFKNAEEILNNDYCEIAGISFGYCKCCNKWVVTH